VRPAAPQQLRRPGQEVAADAEPVPTSPPRLAPAVKSFMHRPVYSSVILWREYNENFTGLAQIVGQL
jgi:hypothetical protein